MYRRMFGITPWPRCTRCLSTSQPNCNNRKCSQKLPNVSLGANSGTEDHCPRDTHMILSPASLNAPFSPDSLHKISTPSTPPFDPHFFLNHSIFFPSNRPNPLLIHFEYYLSSPVDIQQPEGLGSLAVLFTDVAPAPRIVIGT